ncbi:unnamed protein product [Clonostachys solani]|uniref:Uncharacterized protein n=1 Tax=Clonostachys solani TaxID=160281 RepID=A0A9N9Z6R0_9HYPO|nr:unnamed protein product [Clonostachys solani]
MASILSVPPEVIINILKLLNPFEIDAVARTLNSHLYHPAMHLNASCHGWVQNARAMCKLFPPSGYRRLLPSWPGHIPVLGECELGSDQIPASQYEDYGLDPSGGPFFRSSPPNLRSWMKLDGSFDWLEPLDGKISDESARHRETEGGHQPAPKSQVDKLIAKATKLGLTLPVGFETFFSSDRLHYRIPSTRAWYFFLGKLVKCPWSMDNGAGGYILRFYCDQQWCAFAYLYLSPSGYHCVWYSALDLYAEMGIEEEEMEDYDEDEQNHDDDELEEEEEGQGEDGGNDNEEDDDDDDDDDDDHETLPQISKKKIALVALTFEEYLAMVYFEELLQFGSTAFEGLCDYVQHTYLSPVKIQHMRESCPAVNSFLRAIRWGSKARRQRLTSPDLWPYNKTGSLEGSSANFERMVKA